MPYNIYLNPKGDEPEKKKGKKKDEEKEGEKKKRQKDNPSTIRPALSERSQGMYGGGI
ncbi:MAG: hypothetical protein ACLRSW_08650 [Christensenellaceae bacterium]